MLVVGDAAANGVQLVALTDITYVEMNKIQQGAGSPEDKMRASAVLLTQFLVTTGMAAFSVKGAGDVHALAGKPLEIVEDNGRLILRVVGDKALLASEPKATTHEGRTPPRSHGEADSHTTGAEGPVPHGTPPAGANRGRNEPSTSSRSMVVASETHSPS